MPYYDPEKHHRRSIRLKGYDYTQAGAYFVTLVTWRRDEIFGRVAAGSVQLSPLGQIVQDEWQRSIGIRKEIILHHDEFIIMPNHMHAIVRIIPTVAGGARPENGDGVEEGARPIQEEEGARRAPQQIIPKSLGAFIAGFKSSVTSRARRELDLTAVWQRNYYDHIIRNENEFRAIWNYIDANPRKWEADQFHPAAPPNRFNQEN